MWSLLISIPYLLSSSDNHWCTLDTSFPCILANVFKLRSTLSYLLGNGNHVKLRNVKVNTLEKVPLRSSWTSHKICFSHQVTVLLDVRQRLPCVSSWPGICYIVQAPQTWSNPSASASWDYKQGPPHLPKDDFSWIPFVHIASQAMTVTI